MTSASSTRRKSRAKRPRKTKAEPKSATEKLAEDVAFDIDQQVVQDVQPPQPPEAVEVNGQKLVRVERDAVRTSMDDLENSDFQLPQGETGQVQSETDPEESETNEPEGETEPLDSETEQADDEPETEAPAEPSKLEQIVQKHTQRDEQPEPEELPSVEQVAARTQLHGHTNPVPPTESDPAKREKPTMGPVSFTAAAAPDLSDPKAKPRSLEDLMGTFPVGDGQYFIRVNRRGPKTWSGYHCAGVQRPIRTSMTMGQFVREYGGGEYTLTVYGPPKRGGIPDPESGRIRPKALTGDVPLTVPYAAPYGGPPNPEASINPEDELTEDEWMQQEDEQMRYGPAFRPIGTRPTTPADAKIHEADLLAHEREQERIERLARERAEQSASLPSQIAPLLDTVQSSSARMLEMMTERQREETERVRAEREEERQRRIELEKERTRREEEDRKERKRASDEERQKLEEERQRLASKPSAAEELANATQAMMSPVIAALTRKGDGEGKSEAEALRLHIAQMQDANKSELQRIHEAHQSEMRREREAHEAALRREQERAQDIAERAEKRSAEAEERADRRIREVQERAERDVRQAKEDGDKRVADAERIWKDRLEDERRNHERELRSLNTSFDTRVSTEKSIADNARMMLQGEVERERSEKVRYQQEATEKGDIVAQVQKVTAVAESLGMKPAGESETPGDWKSQLLQVGVNLAQNLPEIVQNAGDAVAKAKNPHVQVIQQPGMYAAPALPPAPGMSAPMMPAAPGAFATEDGVDFEGTPGTSEAYYPGAAATRPGMVPPQAQAEPIAPAPDMMGQSVPPPEPAQPIAAQMPPGPPIAPAPAAPPAAMPPPPQNVPLPPAAPAPQRRTAAPAPQPAPAAAPAPQPAAASVVPDEQILALRPVFEDAFNQRISADQFAEDLIAESGADLVRQIVAVLTPEAITAALTKSPEGARSPLVRREGQQWLKAIFVSVRKRVGT